MFTILSDRRLLVIAERLGSIGVKPCSKGIHQCVFSSSVVQRANDMLNPGLLIASHDSEDRVFADVMAFAETNFLPKLLNLSE